MRMRILSAETPGIAIARKARHALHLQDMRLTRREWQRIDPVRTLLHRRLHIGPYILGLGQMAIIRGRDLIPGVLLAAVTAELSHEADERAADHVVAVVERFAGA